MKSWTGQERAPHKSSYLDRSKHLSNALNEQPRLQPLPNKTMLPGYNVFHVNLRSRQVVRSLEASLSKASYQYPGSGLFSGIRLSVFTLSAEACQVNTGSWRGSLNSCQPPCQTHATHRKALLWDEDSEDSFGHPPQTENTAPVHRDGFLRQRKKCPREKEIMYLLIHATCSSSGFYSISLSFVVIKGWVQGPNRQT